MQEVEERGIHYVRLHFIAAKDAEKDTKEYNFPMLRLLVTAGGDIEYETGNGKSVQNPTGFQSQPRRDINAFILECAKVREESMKGSEEL